MLRICSFRKHNHAQLNIVTNAQLWNAYTVFISHLCNLFILHSFSMGYRRIGLHYDTLRLAIFNKVQGSVGDMAKYLIYHGFDLTAFPKIVNVFSYEVWDSDSSNPAGLIGILQGSPCFSVSFDIAIIRLVDLSPRLRRMDNHHIDIVKPHRCESFVYSGGSLFICLVFSSYLGGDKNFFSIHPTRTHSFANTFFISICLRCINVAVTKLYSCPDSICRLVIINQPCSERQSWHLNSIH